MTEPAAQSSPPPRPRRLWGWSLFALLTMGVAVVAAVGAWYVWRDAEGDRVRLLATLDEMTIQLNQLEKLRETQTAISLHQDEAASALATLSNRMDTAEQQQVRLANLIEGGRRHWQVVEVEQLLLIANNRLQLHHDAVGALHAMNIANQRLGDFSEPRLLATREILAQEISTLKALPQVDIEALTLQLTSLISRITDLPLATDLPRNFDNIATDPAARDSESTGWRRLLDNVLTAARGMLQVRQADRPLVPLLPPEQSFFLQQNLILKLETARLALLQRDTASYRSALDAAHGWIKAFYNQSDSGVQSAILEITEMGRQDLEWAQPDISRSLESLRRFMTLSGQVGNTQP